MGCWGALAMDASLHARPAGACRGTRQVATLQKAGGSPARMRVRLTSSHPALQRRLAQAETFHGTGPATPRFGAWHGRRWAGKGGRDERYGARAALSAKDRGGP